MNLIQIHRLESRTRAAAFALTVLGVFATVAGQRADAAASDELPRVVLEYDVHSLATDGGARALYRRLQGATRRVCPEARAHDLAGRTAVNQCRQESLARALRDIDSARLARVASIL